MMKNLIIILVILMVKAYSQTSIFEKFEYIDDNNDTLRYCLSKPDNIEKTKLYPLVIFLHGAGERGYDNQKQLTHIEKPVSDSSFRKLFPCFVLAPQCPPNKRWVEVDWSAPSHTMPEQPSIHLKLLLELVSNLLRKEKIDETRIYVTGLSMGGYGTWDLISRYPDLFAAAAPICGGGDEKQASKLTKIPIWNFHGTLDKAVSVERSRNMIKAIRNAGGNPIYTEYLQGTHNVWTITYNNQLFWDWLFNQKINR